MNSRELYAVWAPDESPWSLWAKPVLFVHMPVLGMEPHPPTNLPEARYLPAAAGETAVIADLAGAESVWFGLRAGSRGYRPIPLFNGCEATGEVIPTEAIVHALRSGAALLRTTVIRAGAPPVFLLDTNRLAFAGEVAPGRFDNRWAVVPQDFPSGTRLRAAGIRRVLVVQARPHADLAHVLLRYKESGLELLEAGVDSLRAQPLQVLRPRWYRSIMYRALVMLNLRRNAAGGFGAVVPEPSSYGVSG